MSLYIFDLDKTLIKGNGSFKFYFYLYSARFFSPFSVFYSISYYLRHRFFRLSLAGLHQKVFKTFLEGRSLIEVLRYVDLFLDQKLDKMLNPKTLSYLTSAKENGHHISILSSSPSFLVKPIAERLKVDSWRATEYGRDSSSNFTKIDLLVEGEEKAVIAKELAKKLSIDIKEIVVFTDSISDLPLARIAGRVVAVRPDRKLRSICRREGWEII